MGTGSAKQRMTIAAWRDHKVLPGTNAEKTKRVEKQVVIWEQAWNDQMEVTQEQETSSDEEETEHETSASKSQPGVCVLCALYAGSVSQHDSAYPCLGDTATAASKSLPGVCVCSVCSVCIMCG